MNKSEEHLVEKAELSASADSESNQGSSLCSRCIGLDVPRRMIGSTRASSPTACVAIFCWSVTWRAHSGIGNLLVRQAVQLKNKIAVPLMEAGVSYTNRSCTRWVTSAIC